MTTSITYHRDERLQALFDWRDGTHEERWRMTPSDVIRNAPLAIEALERKNMELQSQLTQAHSENAALRDTIKLPSFTAGNCESVAWHLEQGHDNGKIDKEVLAVFLRHVAKEIRCFGQVLATSSENPLLKEVDNLRSKLEKAEAINREWEQVRTRQERDLKALRMELTSYRSGGVTEEILRRNDGYIKVGKGCVIVNENYIQKLKEKLSALVKACRPAYGDPESRSNFETAFNDANQLVKQLKK